MSSDQCPCVRMYYSDRPKNFVFEDEADLNEMDVYLLAPIPAKPKIGVNHLATVAFLDPCGFKKLK